MNNLQAIAQRYLAAWNERAPAARRAQVAAIFADESSYVDPMMRGAGIDGIDAMIGAAQQHFPQHRFELSRDRQGAAGARPGPEAGHGARHPAAPAQCHAVGGRLRAGLPRAQPVRSGHGCGQARARLHAGAGGAVSGPGGRPPVEPGDVQRAGGAHDAPLPRPAARRPDPARRLDQRPEAHAGSGWPAALPGQLGGGGGRPAAMGAARSDGRWAGQRVDPAAGGVDGAARHRRSGAPARPGGPGAAVPAADPAQGWTGAESVHDYHHPRYAP